jgi:hypothetical protein
MDYFIARMDSLSPAMKHRPSVITIAANLKTIRALSVQTIPPSRTDVERMRDLADEAMGAAFSRQSP